ncbi:Putative peroxiredoxin bcp (modular protein) [Methylacidimicrobium sp. AP8]|uniref:peroxiredoxin n=1 Tax=Methylacidimicrobium sp. AP8 TaxID=2730359 RepID=UPI0018C16D39|nr:peroxiredoxin [Methylacidimicrobium sp. AP8]CAB4243633.1 Putative peroxiredoxin bcp (modular protein) [Methylacidimicrobium sp. AP8]
MRKPLLVGSRAPAATLRDPEGRSVALADLLAAGKILLYFYPRAHTPYCTKQACNLRDHGKELAAWGIQIIGVSGDSPERLASFRRRYALPFLLLSDGSGEAARAFGLPAFLGFVKRASFLIEEGVVSWRDLHPRVEAHAQDLLRMLAARGRMPLPGSEEPSGAGEERDPGRPLPSCSSDD